MRRAVLTLVVLAACAGEKAPPPPAAPRAKAVHPGLERLRAADAAFVGSPGRSADFDALVAAVAAERAALPAAGRAEADLVLVLAAARVLGDQLEDLADRSSPAHELVAATVLPVVFGERPLDGELAPAYRDRLCQGPATALCQGVLPDFWGAALAYGAAARLREQGGVLAGACACGARYRERVDALDGLASTASERDAGARPGWGLEQDALARSAFAEPVLGPPPRALRVTLEGGTVTIAGGAAVPLAKAAELTRALVAARADLDAILVEARTDTRPGDLAALAAAAARAGVVTLVLETRSAAPPHPRALLRVEIVRGRPPRGATSLAIKPKAGMQAIVDQIDTALGAGAAAPPRVVLVVR